jgi:hypothetical protein
VATEACETPSYLCDVQHRPKNRSNPYEDSIRGQHCVLRARLNLEETHRLLARSHAHLTVYLDLRNYDMRFLFSGLLFSKRRPQDASTRLFSNHINRSITKHHVARVVNLPPFQPTNIGGVNQLSKDKFRHICNIHLLSSPCKRSAPSFLYQKKNPKEHSH